MAYHFYHSKVIDIIDESPNVKRYFFEIPEVEKFDFVAGQFVMLDLPIDSKITTRAYSIASPPLDNNIIELLIVLKEDGLGTPYLFKNIKVNSQVSLSQPLGKFIQPRPSSFETDLCFICTGTGIAPFRSMLLDIYNHKVPHKNIHLIFGCRHQEDILYKKEMEDLQAKLENFHFIPVLSRETGRHWKGETGYVHHIYQKIFAHKRSTLFYICGWKAMIMEARKNLQEMGYDKKEIKFELFD